MSPAEGAGQAHTAHTRMQGTKERNALQAHSRTTAEDEWDTYDMSMMRCMRDRSLRMHGERTEATMV